MELNPQMSRRPTEPFREEHAELLPHVEQLRTAARGLPRLPPEARREAIDAALGFLRGTLLPHARAEEDVLYPEWSRIVGYPGAAAPMVHDHEAIASRIERLAACSPEDIETAQELLYGLHALVSVHFQKEEEIQLPAFDREPPEAVEEVLHRMHHAAHGSHATA
jgi:iron-sulfur cluster repair protein YtfE (RIC family)